MEVNGVKYDLSPGYSVEEIDPSIIDPFEKSQKGFSKGFIKIKPSDQVNYI